MRCGRILVFSLCLSALPSFAQTPEPLAADGVTECPLEPGATRAYALPVHAGDFVHLWLHGTAPASLRIVDEAGKELAAGELNWESNDHHFALLAPAAGTLRVELKTLEPAPSNLRLKLTGPRQPTPADRKKLEGERLFDDFIAQVTAGTPEGTQKGLLQLEAALKLWDELNDAEEQVTALLNLGAMHGAFGDTQRATAELTRAIALARTTGEPRLLPEALEVLAGEMQKQRKLDEALALDRESVELRGKLHDREAIALYSLGASLSFLDRVSEAIEAYSVGLEKARAAHDPLMEGRIAENRASLLSASGSPEQALPDLRAALDFHRKNKFVLGEGVVLNQLGNAYILLDDRDEAIRHYRAALIPLREAHDPGWLSHALSNLAASLLADHKPQEAFDVITEALQVAGPNAAVQVKGSYTAILASAEIELGRPAQARERLRALVPETDRTEYRGADLTTLRYIAHADHLLGDDDEALRLAQRVVDQAEAQRKVLLGDGVRSRFLSSRRLDYRRVLEILLSLHQKHPEQGFDQRAFGLSERARARSLLDLLEEGQVDIREGVDPALLQHERDTVKQLSQLAKEQTRLRARPHTDAETARLDKQLFDQNTEYQRIEAELRTKSPRYTALTQPEPLGVQALQRDVLDDGTLLLEFALGELKSALFVVGKTSFATYILPKRAELEAAAREVYAAWSDPGTADDRERTRREAALSKLLFGQVGQTLGKKRLVFVSEGALQYVPLASLPVPGAKTPRPLLADHEIVSLPSASTLALLRKDTAARAPAEKLVAVLADPVFDPHDARVTGDKSPLDPSKLLASAQLTRSAKESGLATFERLGSTRREADGIIALAGKERSFEALDFDASLATAQDPALGRYRFLHFASHGLLDSRHPELSGIVLSTVDRQGKPQEGFLQLHDIYNLRLSADLVVLSACQTALGGDVWGEGFVGLVRGFMYAGASRVVASAWKVPDRATSELMERFYTGMLSKKLTPAAALREAQLSLWRSRKLSHPHDWASFTLQGDWK
ncbi:MAG: CHAT domain-containing protein [Deltaproteobacteria bacterium]|nr:CHAT domain-containing protein [Deltaproteobacteria bacterium]